MQENLRCLILEVRFSKVHVFTCDTPSNKKCMFNHIHTLLALSDARSLYFELVKIVTGMVSDNGLNLFSNLENQITYRFNTYYTNEKERPGGTVL